jgi:tetratricopeptide (TPR) repeat protein
MAFLGNFEKGEALCERGLRFAIESNHLASLGYAEFVYAVLFDFKGDGESAVDHAKNSIRYSEEAQFVGALGHAWWALGAGYYLLGDLEAARNHIEKGLKIHTDAGLSFNLSGFFRLLSMVHFDSGDLKSAQSCAEKAVELSQENNEKSNEGSSRIFLGRILGKRDPSQNDKAEESILQGIKILDELKLRPFFSQGYLSLGELYADTDQKEKALENLKKAEGMFQEMGMDYWLAKTREVLGKL